MSRDEKNSSYPLFPEASSLVSVPLSESGYGDKQHLLALSRIKGLGYATLRRPYRRLPGLGQLWNLTEDELTDLFKQFQVRNERDIAAQIKRGKDQLLNQANSQLESLGKKSIYLITDKDDLFPQSLKDIPNPPYWLFVEGHPHILKQKNIVAIVGTRNPTEEGKVNAKLLTELAVEKGLIVLSGLADGIDEIVHETVIGRGGKTIGVLGTGLSVVFPAGSGSMRRAIVETGGATVTEYFLYDSYSRDRFIQRNRIQAALSAAVFPIQCGAKSGTSHTIKFAESLNRMVIGVCRGQPEPIVQNEVFKLLKNKNHPVFDLDSEQEKLWALLNPILDCIPSENAAGTETNCRKFETVIREFTQVLRRHPVSKDELEDLTRILREEWDRAKNHDGY